MSYETERVDITSYLETNWTTTSIKFPNQRFEQPNDEIWMKINIVNGEGTQQSFGTVQDHEFVGLITLTLYAPLYSGTKTINEYIDTLFDLFVSKTIGSVFTYTPSKEVIGENGNWYQVALTIPFTRDKLVTP